MEMFKINTNISIKLYFYFSFSKFSTSTNLFQLVAKATFPSSIISI